MSATIIFPLLLISVGLSALFAGAAFALIKGLNASNPALRTSLWSLAFFLSATTPLISFMPGGNEAIVFQSALATPANSITAVEGPATPPENAAPTAAPTAAKNTRSFAELIAVSLIVLWLTGFVWRSINLARDAWSISRLRRESTPIEARADGKTAPYGVLMLRHPKLVTPIATGIVRPVIILPPSDANNLNSDATQHAIAHEMAHIQRGDLVASFVETVILLVFWWNPLMWKMRAKIAGNREMACDDRAVKHSEDAHAYSYSLIEFAERVAVSQKSQLPGAVLAASGNPANLSERITRLMSDDYASSARHSISKSMIAGAAIMALTAGVAVAAPRIVVETTQFHNNDRPAQSPASSEEEALGRSLVRAITEGQWLEADTLIAAGADINAVLEGDGTPLIAAVNEGSTRYASKLISLGADVNADAIFDETALISAVRSDADAMVRLLIDAGADVNQSARTENGVIRSPLGEAIRLRYGVIERALRDAGAA